MPEISYSVSMKDMAFNWCMTIVITAFLLPFTALGSEFLSGPYELSDYLLIGLLSTMIAGSSGIPFFLFLMLATSLMNAKQWSFTRYRLIWHPVYLLVSAAYFLLILLFTGIEFLEVFWSMALTYTLCGIAVWNLFFWLNRRKLQNNTTHG